VLKNAAASKNNNGESSFKLTDSLANPDLGLKFYSIIYGFFHFIFFKFIFFCSLQCIISFSQWNL